ncbi:uncharacterized protein LOC126816426 isoform X2 [Patella vulgata]|uniref:uncharacterized protein LOC126816426 isoform X2 n=1 Tax=Patella vulgata TaxID=6465 RepID=UPI0021809B83|nr:uncharacterized protein LOC126816426 isoform X2 [Patella vulgata]
MGIEICHATPEDNTMLMLMLMLVGTVTAPIPPDSVFEWGNTTNPVISTMRQRITLEWIYQSKEPVSSMVFTRFKNSKDIEVPVGKWTKEGGFKPDPFISTELTLNTVHINGTNENKVSLILENPIHIDYDLQYNCQVNFGDPVKRDSLSIELRALRPYWINPENEKYATLEEDVTFIWEYRYPHQALAVFIRRENNSESEMVEVGYWYQDEFTDQGQFINRVVLTKTPNEDKTSEEINLTLKRVSVEDLWWQYVCRLTLGDGEQLLKKTLLKEEVKLNTVTSRADSRTSTATRSPVGYSTVILVIVCSIISHISKD